MNTLLHQTLQCFDLLSAFLQPLTAERYQQPFPQFYGGTIGKHTRHILEFYQQLLTEEQPDCLNYDARKRELAFENCPLAARRELDRLAGLLASPLADRPLRVDAAVFEAVPPVQSSFYRELFYAYEHMVHHMALLKVGCYGMKDLHFSETFGLAYATAQHRAATCAP